MSINPELYTDELIRAIDDWQSGSRNKQKKAEVLRKASSHLPEKFRKVPESTYRQVRANAALGVGIALDAIPDKISSWTTSLEVAKSFREGDLDREKVLMLFVRHPKSEDVILNLNEIYADRDFTDSVKAAEKRLRRQYKGISFWQNSQQEVVLDEAIVGNDQIISIGAYQQLEDIVPQIGERAPSAPSDDEIQRELIGNGGDEHFWTSPEGASNGVKKAAQRCRDYLKDKRLWPESIPF